MMGAVSDPGLALDTSLSLSYQSQLYNIPTHTTKSGVWYCGSCQMIQPAKAGHCQFCMICIEGYDHHCPWTGKCIGRKNMVWFVLFLISTVIYFTYFIYTSM